VSIGYSDRVQPPALDFADPPAPAVAPTGITIADRTIDVWPFTMTCADESLAAWEALLDPSERERGQRFYQARHRHEFVVAHGVTRHVLSRYAGVAPEALRFVRNASGKPALAGIDAPIDFNLTHSGGRAVLAVATQSIGVDLEERRADRSAMEIAERFFYGDELASIRSRPIDEQNTMFFRFWVAKEAVLKAEGIGLGYPLDRFAVKFSSDNPDRASVRSADPSRLRETWHIRMLGGDPAWPVAITAQGTDWQVQQRSLQSPSTPRPFP
jgi:4'-phosphopantetheinyl transferase